MKNKAELKKVYLGGWRYGMVKRGHKRLTVVEHIACRVKITYLPLSVERNQIKDPLTGHSDKWYARHMLKMGRHFGITKGAKRVLREVLA